MSLVTSYRTITISMPDDIDRSDIERAVLATARANNLECRRSGDAGDSFHLSKPVKGTRNTVAGFLRLISGGKQ